MTYSQYYHFSAAYGEGTYNTSTYQNGTTTAAPTGTGTVADGGATATNGNILTNTGVDLLAGASFACLLIAVAVATRFGRRKKASTN